MTFEALRNMMTQMLQQMEQQMTEMRQQTAQILAQVTTMEQQMLMLSQQVSTMEENLHDLQETVGNLVDEVRAIAPPTCPGPLCPCSFPAGGGAGSPGVAAPPGLAAAASSVGGIAAPPGLAAAASSVGGFAAPPGVAAASSSVSTLAIHTGQGAGSGNNDSDSEELSADEYGVCLADPYWREFLLQGAVWGTKDGSQYCKLCNKFNGAWHTTCEKHVKNLKIWRKYHKKACGKSCQHSLK